MSQTPARNWQGADAYQAYMGRWSFPMARAFVGWFGAEANLRWVDVGCGTGALATAVLEGTEPREVVGIDPSSDFIAMAKERVTDPRARFEVGDGRDLPLESGPFDVAAAGLVVNHVPEPELAAAEMVRVVRSGGLVGAYVWDYMDQMQLIRTFWDGVDATGGHERSMPLRPHYEICKPGPLQALFETAGLSEVTVEAIDLPLHFPDFDDFWVPHTLNGPAPVHRYTALLDEGQKADLREALRGLVPIGADGSIDLIGRAWAVRGTKPGS